MQITQNVDHATRVCARFVYSIVKITTLYECQTLQTSFMRNSQGVQRFVGIFLDCAFRMLIGWAETLQPHEQVAPQKKWLV